MDAKDLHKTLGSEYEPQQHNWVREHARLMVCSAAKDAKDAELLLETLGLLSDTRASDSDSINDTALATERSD